MPEAAEKSLPKVVEVTLDDGEVVTVEKLPLGRAAQLVMSLKNLPKKIKALAENEELRKAFARADDMEVTEFAVVALEAMPEILNIATEEVVNILAVGTGLPKKRLEALGIAEVLSLIEAVLVVNDVKAIWRRGKNIAALLSLQQ